MIKARIGRAVAAPCRFHWAPSRALSRLAGALGLLAGIAVIASELPLAVSLPMAAGCLACGHRLAARQAVASAVVVIPPGTGAVTIDGTEVEEFRLLWRGPMVFASWRRAGRLRFLVGGPDNVGPAARRELRLAMAGRMPAHPRRSMAP